MVHNKDISTNEFCFHGLPCSQRISASLSIFCSQ